MSSNPHHHHHHPNSDMGSDLEVVDLPAVRPQERKEQQRDVGDHEPRRPRPEGCRTFTLGRRDDRKSESAGRPTVDGFRFHDELSCPLARDHGGQEVRTLKGQREPVSGYWLLTFNVLVEARADPDVAEVTAVRSNLRVDGYLVGGPAGLDVEALAFDLELERMLKI